MAPRPQRPRDDFVGVVNDLVRRVRDLELGVTGRSGGGVPAAAGGDLTWYALDVVAPATHAAIDNARAVIAVRDGLVHFDGGIRVVGMGNYLQVATVPAAITQMWGQARAPKLVAMAQSQDDTSQWRPISVIVLIDRTVWFYNGPLAGTWHVYLSGVSRWSGTDMIF